MKTQNTPTYPIEIDEPETHSRRGRHDGRLAIDADNLEAVADLVSDIYMHMKCRNRNQLTHVFGLAYLCVLEEMDQKRSCETCN